MQRSYSRLKIFYKLQFLAVDAYKSTKILNLK